MLFSHIGEYASDCSEYESMKFAVNSPKIVNRLHLGHTSCQRLPMPYELLTIVANDANGLKNNIK